MDALTQKSRQQRLKRELNKSLGSVRLSKNKKLTLADKSKIKKVAVKGLQRYLTAEIKRTNTKTYDWYFFKDDGELFHIEAFRNSLNHNRYFIVDHEQVMIESKFALGSSYGQQRITQYDISSKEIGDIISSSKKLFADIMRITVSEKEDAKIWKSYDTIDEKSIITITLGLPVAIIASAEAVPLMVMASKSSLTSSAVSSLGKSFTINSFRTGLYNGGANLFGQLATNDFKFDEKIDYFDPLISGVSGGWGSLVAESAFELRFSNEGVKFGYEGHQNFVVNTFTGLMGSQTGEKLSNFTKPLTDLSPNIGGLMTDFLGGSVIGAGGNVLGEEIKLKLEIEKND
ncbi:hypothetical protein [Zobellia uliginosa]|uniref:hypothetical protein n=1 Tax=Zobellia uliginosa TaxID=143224 RepID=UPI001C07DB73|nr:hypothetical protein [Zobellia uliginosa]MBU2946330.1 hypothetical protein [Zobellia uliginosa]